MLYRNYHKTAPVKLTHYTTGYVAEVDKNRSQYKNYKACLHILKSMLYAKLYGPQKLIRSYVISDNATTIIELETGSCVGMEGHNECG